MATAPPAADLERPELGVALGQAGVEVGAPHLLRLLGQEEQRHPAVGDLGGHLDVLRAERRDPDRDPGPHGVGDDLERLAQPGALLGRAAAACSAPVVGEAVLAGPHLAADLDDLPGAAERLVVRDAVPALDHLRARRAEAELAAAVGEGVDARRRHGEERGRPGVDRQDARRDLHGLGAGGEVAHEARRVEAVGLGHPDEVEPSLLQLGDLVGRLLEPTGVAELHADLHRGLRAELTVRSRP